MKKRELKKLIQPVFTCAMCGKEMADNFKVFAINAKIRTGIN